jgi:predicted dehydrogenase
MEGHGRHPVDLVRWYMGNVAEVFAYGGCSLIGEQEGFQGNDIFVINLKFTNGKIGRVLGFYGLEQPHQQALDRGCRLRDQRYVHR